MQVLVVGAGFSGAVVARELALKGHKITVIESRDHVAGNCHTERCPDTGILVHIYGPHIFHTSDRAVWNYVNGFGSFEPYRHQVRTTVRDAVFEMPINLHTINQFFGKTFSPSQAQAFIEQTQADQSITSPQNFEDMALSLVGPALYEAFFKGYTQKQWGRAPSDLPAAIFNRLPLRYTYNDNYFAHNFQGQPTHGYTALIEAMLDHPSIDVHLNTPFQADMTDRADHMFWSGPLDGYFGHAHGTLGYRTLDFERFVTDEDFQGCAVMNYGDGDTPWTRITEHKYFAPWEAHEKSVLYREVPRECGPNDSPYYPVRLAHEKELLSQYETHAKAEDGVTFLGRLGTYRYLDMDVTIREALDLTAAFPAA
ncbi:MAG: UDP-galactopyranose mutase [Yoonia sp.]|uniref:UDP-galactopyranose mutase n=1 Tax=Yoonia sp. TaxID=2212373 RepID=UPI003EF81408